MGHELPANSSGNQGVGVQGGAETGELLGDSRRGGELPALANPDLAAVIDAWPALPEADRQRTMVTVLEESGI